MLVVETIGRIRRDHLVKGKSIREIAREVPRVAVPRLADARRQRINRTHRGFGHRALSDPRAPHRSDADTDLLRLPVKQLPAAITTTRA